VETRVDAALERLRPARARVDLDRLAANYAAIARFAGRPVMPVVKADAYGHGADVVGRRLEALGAPMLAVAYPEEGAALREAGVAVPVVVLAGFSAGQVGLLRERRLTPVVSTPATLGLALSASRAGWAGMEVHLKVDTGMTRLGLSPADVEAAALRLTDAGVSIVGLMTHLAAADEDRDATERQLDRFDTAVLALERRGVRPPWIHAANSGGLAFLRPTHTLVRPGLIVYGVRPRPLSPELDVRPVLGVSAAISLVRDVAPGTPVSYGGRFVASRPSRIAVVPLGYADGVPRTRAMAETGVLRVAGRPLRVAGTVCMDLTMLDATEAPEVKEGDEACLLGDAPDAWELADRKGTNAWEVLTSLGSRLPRAYVEGGRVVAVASRYRP
jgi:alanine racemase